MLHAFIRRSRHVHSLLSPQYPLFAHMLAPHPSSTALRAFHSNKSHLDYDCRVDEEPLDRYGPGGYHPVQLGDVFKKDRYKIVHKLGWGSFSTTWLALDRTTSHFVALKICVSKSPQRTQSETSILDAILREPKNLPGQLHIVQMHDTFTLDGPNGNHTCIVQEPLGPCISQLFSEAGSHLPAFVMKASARQTLLAIDCLSDHGIRHGDLHLGNIAFAISSLSALTMDEVSDFYNQPVTASISRKDGEPLGEHFPPYIVESARLDVHHVYKTWALEEPTIKLLDFGQAFLATTPATNIVTPLFTRAPEIIFDGKVDQRVDLWSMGCLLLELATGSSPFQGIFEKPVDMVARTVHYCPDKLPRRWDAQWRKMPGWQMPNESDYFQDLEHWIKATYQYTGNAENSLSEEELLAIVQSAMRLLRYQPNFRADIKTILSEKWLSV